MKMEAQTPRVAHQKREECRSAGQLLSTEVCFSSFDTDLRTTNLLLHSTRVDNFCRNVKMSKIVYKKSPLMKLGPAAANHILKMQARLVNNTQ